MSNNQVYKYTREIGEVSVTAEFPTYEDMIRFIDRVKSEKSITAPREPIVILIENTLGAEKRARVRNYDPTNNAETEAIEKAIGAPAGTMIYCESFPDSEEIVLTWKP